MIEDFLNIKNLLTNSNKSYFIYFSMKQAITKLCPNIFLFYYEEQIDQVQNTKFLSLVID